LFILSFQHPRSTAESSSCSSAAALTITSSNWMNSCRSGRATQCRINSWIRIQSNESIITNTSGKSNQNTEYSRILGSHTSTQNTAVIHYTSRAVNALTVGILYAYQHFKACQENESAPLLSNALGMFWFLDCGNGITHFCC